MDLDLESARLPRVGLIKPQPFGKETAKKDINENSREEEKFNDGAWMLPILLDHTIVGQIYKEHYRSI